MSHRFDDPARAVDAHRRLLDELCAETPSGAEKRRAAWTGLSEQTQMEMLLALSAGQRVVPGDLLALAAASPNAFVRYLAARAHRIIDSDDIAQRDTFARLDADRVPLVAFARHENSWTWGYGDPVAAPQQQRLAMLRGSKPPSPEQFALFVLQALAAGVPEGELLACVIEYVRNPVAAESGELPDPATGAFRSRFAAMRPLWHLLGKLPPRIARDLSRALPAPGSPAEEETLEAVLAELDDRILSTLLMRDDLKLRQLRRRIVTSEKTREEALVAIAASSLELDDEEFGDLLTNRPQRAVWMTRSRALAPVQLAALAGYFAANAAGQSRPAGAWAVSTLKERLGKMTFDARRRVRAELRLLELARQALPWNGEPGSVDAFPSHLGHLAQFVVAGNTWATYCAFAQQLPPATSSASILGEAVPAPQPEPASAASMVAAPPQGAAAVEPVSARRPGSDSMPAAPSARTLARPAKSSESKRRRGNGLDGARGGNPLGGQRTGTPMPAQRPGEIVARAPVVGSAAPAAPPTIERDLP